MPWTTRPSLINRVPKAAKVISKKLEFLTTTANQDEVKQAPPPVSVLKLPIPQSKEQSTLKDARDAEYNYLSVEKVLVSTSIEVANESSFQGDTNRKVGSKEVKEKDFTAGKAETENVMLVENTDSHTQVCTSTENNPVDSNFAAASDCPKMLDKTIAAVTDIADSTTANPDKLPNMSRTKTHAGAVQGGGLADAGSGSNSSTICSSRPVLVKKPSPQKLSLSPTYHSPSKVTQDRGSTCVSVILKSSRLRNKATRLNMVAKKQREVEQLVSSYSLKFCHKSTPGVQVRLDYCFLQSEEARKFFKAVYSLPQTQTQTSPKMVTCILFSEEELGYQHEPVLTEYDLLAIQSPEYCRNIFRTSVLISVKMINDVVVYEFQNVTDVNKFLYNKSSSVKTRSLGLLRNNVVPKMMVKDNQGFYRLFSAGPKIHDSIGKKHGFRLNGPYLLFLKKLDLFVFLVSEEAADIDHLQFYEENIIDNAEIGNNDNEYQILVEPKNGHGGTHEVDVVVSRVEEIKALHECDFELKDSKLKDTRSDEVVACNDVLKEDTTAHDALSFSNKLSIVHSVKVSNDDKKQEVEGISELGDYSDKISKEEAMLPRSILDQEDEEIRSLKKKLLRIRKEKMIQTEIMEKIAVKVDLKNVLSQ